MSVGEQEAVGREQDAGAAALASASAAPQIDYGRPQCLGHAHHDAGIGVESFIFMRRRFRTGRSHLECLAVGNEVLPET